MRVLAAGEDLMVAVRHRPALAQVLYERLGLHAGAERPGEDIVDRRRATSDPASPVGCARAVQAPAEVSRSSPASLPAVSNSPANVIVAAPVTAAAIVFASCPRATTPDRRADRRPGRMRMDRERNGSASAKRVVTS
jgi:hypothetical protein